VPEKTSMGQKRPQIQTKEKVLPGSVTKALNAFTENHNLSFINNWSF
jgi:hypothetical protein